MPVRSRKTDKSIVDSVKLDRIEWWLRFPPLWTRWLSMLEVAGVCRPARPPSESRIGVVCDQNGTRRAAAGVSNPVRNTAASHSMRELRSTPVSGVGGVSHRGAVVSRRCR